MSAIEPLTYIIAVESVNVYLINYSPQIPILLYGTYSIVFTKYFKKKLIYPILLDYRYLI